MASRDPKTLHPELAKRWDISSTQYAAQYPNAPQPFLTQTLRTSAEQDKLYAQGRTRPGKVVTNARGGQSLHNYGLAFDIAFRDHDGSVLWDVPLFARFAAIAKANGLAWGGDWKSFKDYPHFDPPGMTWQKAKAGEAPRFGPISVSEEARVCSCCGKPL